MARDRRLPVRFLRFGPHPLSSFAGLTGESIYGQRANGPMDPPVKPEGDGGEVGWQA